MFVVFWNGLDIIRGCYCYCDIRLRISEFNFWVIRILIFFFLVDLLILMLINIWLRLEIINLGYFNLFIVVIF